MIRLLLIIQFFALANFASANSSINRMIYGEDNRVDVNLYPDTNIHLLAESVAGQIWNRQLIEDNTNTEIVNFKSESLGSVFNICKEEKFVNQQLLPRCTGFLIAEDKLLTAGHCLSTDSKISDPQSICDKTSWTFSFNNKKSSFYKNEIYQCDKVLAYSEDYDKDFAIISLKRSTHLKPLTLNYSTPKLYEELLSIGHGAFLPKKVYDDAYFADFDNGLIYTNLDTFIGNSGSPVFSKETNTVIGILIGGGEDFQYDKKKSCLTVNRKSNKASDAEEEVLPLMNIKEIIEETLRNF